MKRYQLQNDVFSLTPVVKTFIWYKPEYKGRPLEFQRDVFKDTSDQQFRGSCSLQSLREIKILLLAVLLRLFDEPYFLLDFNDSRFIQQSLSSGLWVKKVIKIDTKKQNVECQQNLQADIYEKFTNTGTGAYPNVHGIYVRGQRGTTRRQVLRKSARSVSKMEVTFNFKR
jgi:hypothetical protein